MDSYEAIEFAINAWEKVGFKVRALPYSQQVVFLIGWLSSEVEQGGVYGWLVNMGEHGPDTVKAFEAVGAHQCAAIVREILAFFPRGTPSPDDQERVRQMMAVEDVANNHWSDLGDRLLRWPDKIDELLHKFVAQHEADFA